MASAGVAATPAAVAAAVVVAARARVVVVRRRIIAVGRRVRAVEVATVVVRRLRLRGVVFAVVAALDVGVDGVEQTERHRGGQDRVVSVIPTRGAGIETALARTSGEQVADASHGFSFVWDGVSDGRGITRRGPCSLWPG